MIIAIGLEASIKLSKTYRNWAVSFSLLIVTIILIFLMAYLNADPDWELMPNIPSSNLMELFRVWSITAAVVLLAAFLIYWLPRHVWLILAGIFLIEAIMLRPMGYHLRADNYSSFVEATDLSISNERIMTPLPANTNLISKFESVGVFDPINNNYFRKFFISHFKVPNPNFHIQAVETPEGLTVSQIDALRLIGTNIIYGFKVQDERLTKLNHSAYKIDFSLPRVYLLSQEAFDEINKDWSQRSVTENVKRLQTEIKRTPAVKYIQFGNRTISFRVDDDFDGVLVINQAYSTNWSFDNNKRILFGNLFPAWKVSIESNKQYIIDYWPRGLTISLILAILGMNLFLLILFKKTLKNGWVKWV